MAIEIKNELAAAAIVDGSDGGAALQLFGLTFTRTGVGVYAFTMTDDIDPTQYGIYCKPGINELAQPCGRFTAPKTLEVRSYLPDGTPADCVVLFVEVHRYPGVVGATFPAAPPIPIPTPGVQGFNIGWAKIDTAGAVVLQSFNNIVINTDGWIAGVCRINLQPGSTLAAALVNENTQVAPTRIFSINAFNNVTVDVHSVDPGGTPLPANIYIAFFG